MNFRCLFGFHDFQYPNVLLGIDLPTLYLNLNHGYIGAIIDKDKNIISDDPDEVKKFILNLEYISRFNKNVREFNETKRCTRCLKREFLQV